MFKLFGGLLEVTVNKKLKKWRGLALVDGFKMEDIPFAVYPFFYDFLCIISITSYISQSRN